MQLDVWLTFFVASWAISISPGAGAVGQMTAGLQHGLRRGYLLTVGLVLGLWLQLALVGVGLGAVIAASSAAFTVIKWAGVAYLLWLGLSQWRAPAIGLAADAAQGPRHSTGRALVLRGWAINAVNPKATLFMLAVMPQFVDPTRPLLVQYLVIAATLAFTDLVIGVLYTGFAAQAQAVLRTPRRMRWVNRVFGGLFMALAALLATAKRSA
jgi:homoserine/homoserine lactone efflux protein